MDLMTLHPKASEDSAGDLLRTLEPKDATEEEFYYHSTDMPTEMVSSDGALVMFRVHVLHMLRSDGFWFHTTLRNKPTSVTIASCVVLCLLCCRCQ
jgi:hypothetical protein